MGLQTAISAQQPYGKCLLGLELKFRWSAVSGRQFCPPTNWCPKLVSS